MNHAETQWLHDLGTYEMMGGFIPEGIRAGMFYCYCTSCWDIDIYGRIFNIQVDRFADAADWIEHNGPDMPRPTFGL